MTKVTYTKNVDLRPFYSTLIGADRILSRLSQFDTATQNQNYPPYNIIKKGENFFEVQIAVAGFDEGEIDIRVQDGNLIVTGEKKSEVMNEGSAYLHQGISARKFIRTFALAEYVEVVNAVSKNGILTISLELQIPESVKPKTIAINYQS
jgi:molecular chaperone IbpA